MSVVVVGSINQDVVASVDRIPTPGETVLAHSVAISSGGKGANQAVAARRAGGADVSFVGAVGTDVAGDSLRKALVDDAIDVSGLAAIGGPSGTAYISVAADAENTIVVVPGANAVRRSLTSVQRSVVARAQVLLTQLEVPVAFVDDAVRALPADAWHLLNAAPSAPLSTGSRALLNTCHVLIVNEHEAMGIAGTTEADVAIATLAPQVPTLVVTLGGEGSLVVCGRERTRVPAFAARAVDTTAAGDTFCGVLAASLAASGRSPVSLDVSLIAQAARRAAAAAAIAVTRQGAQDSIPTAQEVSALIDGSRS